MKPELLVEPHDWGYRWILITDTDRFEGTQIYSTADAAELQGERQLVAYIENEAKTGG